MPSYRTEVIVASDRYVAIQLPDAFPEGLATVTVSYRTTADPPEDAETPHGPNPEGDRDDIEWWDEFDETRD